MRLCLAVLAVLGAATAAATEVPLYPEFSDGFDPTVDSVFRLGALQLRDPHVFVNVQLGPVTLCTDVTDLPSAGLNAQIAASLAADDDADGFFDTSPLLVFRPLRNDGRPGIVVSTTGACSVAPPLACSVDPAAVPTARRYLAMNLSGSNHCLEPLSGTTSNWGGGAAVVPQPGGSCYATKAADLVLSTGALDIPLFAAAFGAPLPGGGSTGGGLMRGFLRASDAATLIVPVNGTDMTLASVLPGGAGSCKANVTGGVDTWNGVSGWWFYFEYRQDAALP
jgi:hypothetical protein